MGKKPKLTLEEWKQQPLGEVTDRELAAKLGVPPTYVCIVRNLFGIKPCRLHPNNSKHVKISHEVWKQQPFGEMTDIEISKKLGVSRERVRQWRDKLGIPKFINPNSTQNQVINSGLLGKVTDSEIANKFDLSKSYISWIRRELNIPKFKIISPDGCNSPRQSMVLKYVQENPNCKTIDITKFIFGNTLNSSNSYTGLILKKLIDRGLIKRVSYGRYTAIK